MKEGGKNLGGKGKGGRKGQKDASLVSWNKLMCDVMKRSKCLIYISNRSEIRNERENQELRKLI